MKRYSLLMLGGLIVLSPVGQASWFQRYCSNGEGTIKTANGHNENGIWVTIREGTLEERVLEFSGQDVLVDELESRELSSHETGSCEGETDGSALWTSEKVVYNKIKLTKADGQTFPAGIAGLSEDRKSITAELICEEKIENLMLCEQ